MSESTEAPAPICDPLTPRGVAAFARAPLRWLLLAQLMVALLAGGVVVWFLHRGWFPVVRAAIHQLPPEGELRDGELRWEGESPVQLAASPFLGIAVDLYHSNVLGREAHLQIEFGRKDARVISLLGYLPVDYPPEWRMPFDRTRLGPWWGAWEPALLAAAGLTTMVALMLTWTILATLYVIPVRVIALLERRKLNWGQSWRLAGAALLPGALFLTCAIIAYGLSFLDLVRLGGLAGLHFLIGWVYLLISPLFLPGKTPAVPAQTNPFATAEGAGPKPSQERTSERPTSPQPSPPSEGGEGED